MPNWDNWLNDMALWANWIIYVGSIVLLFLVIIVLIAIIVSAVVALSNTLRTALMWRRIENFHRKEKERAMMQDATRRNEIDRLEDWFKE